MKHKFKPILIKDVVSMELTNKPHNSNFYSPVYHLTLTTLEPIPYAQGIKHWNQPYAIELGNKKQGYKRIEFIPNGNVETSMTANTLSWSTLEYTTYSTISKVKVIPK